MYKQEVEDLKAEFSRADFLVKVKFKFLILVSCKLSISWTGYLF